MHLDDPTKDPRRKTSEESTPSADRQDDRGGPGGAAIQFERKGDGPVAAGQVASVEQATRETVAGASTAFPHQEAIQRSFGTHRVDGLQSIVGGPAGPMNRSLESNAFTVEGRVAFSQQPDLRQAAHEATHALQQQRGLVPAGSVSRPGDGFERQADRVADQVVAGRSAEDELDSMQGGGGSGAALQFDGSKKNERNTPVTTSTMKL